LRREAFAGFPEGEALRDRARAIKEATLQQLDDHLEQLVGNIERLGATSTTPRIPRRRAASWSTSRGGRARGWP
jgi:hypothetical protein